ncbi:MAG: MarR family transcriptional regulator [Methanothrix sp.]|nr:MarR family transcriptional regulator [Methanothrix sp.]
MQRWNGTLSLIALLAMALFTHAVAQDLTADLGNLSDQRLILNVYLDNAGKAFVTGYAEDLRGLPFLNASQYRLENDSHQLYALTDSLTTKSGDIWTISFANPGYYRDYRVTFYLPSEMRMGRINLSAGLEYLLSAYNESLVVDVQGYEVRDPEISVQYQQPLNSSPKPPPPPGRIETGAMVLLLFAGLLLAGGLAGVLMMRQRHGYRLDQQPEGSIPPVTASDEGPSQGASSDESAPDPEDLVAPEELAAEAIDAVGSSRPESIALSSEMEAVLQTLTARERAVMMTLIGHGGRMTQAEIRYETGTPKSSLTGILTSLERRRLVTKKEWGRTNIIELSEWFLSKRERS